MLHILLRYTQALLTQMAQAAVCNRHHSVDQQLSRWLLLSLDRLASNKLTMTEELIANMLDVRREAEEPWEIPRFCNNHRRAPSKAGRVYIDFWI